MKNQETNTMEKSSMQITMESCIEYAKTLKVSEEWKKGALEENIETMIETMNLYVSNPNPFWQSKFIKLYSQAQSLIK